MPVLPPYKSISSRARDPDMAAVNVQNRVSKAQGLLPAEVTKIGVTTQKRQTSFLQIGALVSTDGRYDQTFLANYLDINVIPQIKRIEGVGDVMELGDTYSMRIWLKPERMAQYGLVPSDVTARIGRAEHRSPYRLAGREFAERLPVHDEVSRTPEERGGVPEHRGPLARATAPMLRLKDVADVELGTLTYSFRSEMDSQPAVLYHDLPDGGLQRDRRQSSRLPPRWSEMEEEPARRDGVRHHDEFQRLPLRFHTQRGGDTGHRHHTGHPRGVLLPAGPQEYAHTRPSPSSCRWSARLPAWWLRGSVSIS